jgi:phosphate transport system ATP-binding protein
MLMNGAMGVSGQPVCDCRLLFPGTHVADEVLGPSDPYSRRVLGPSDPYLRRVLGPSDPCSKERPGPGDPCSNAFWCVSGLSVRYRQKTALSSVTVNLPKGEVTAVIGPSGCGKSTFLYCLNRLSASVDGCTVAGRIMVGSQNLCDPRVDDVVLRKRIGFIFQKPNPFPLSIRRNLELPLKEHGVRDRSTIDETIEVNLRAVGLWNEVKDRLNSPAQQLSGGQQQRLCIARALVLRPEALLMDEPCSALDPIAAGVIEELIHSFRQRFTIVIVTHNLRQAKRIGDRVALFWSQSGSGCLVEAGLAGQIFEAPRHELTKLYIAGGIG